MTKIVNLSEAKKRLSSLVALAAAGEEIVIAKRGKPIVRLTPAAVEKRARRKPSGAMKIKWISPDFDDPLPPELLKLFGYDP
jgi:prevent-host-death family protein